MAARLPANFTDPEGVLGDLRPLDYRVGVPDTVSGNIAVGPCTLSGMELKDFIKETLVEIIEGVKDAQGAIDSGSVVGRRQESAQTVDFDVAVTTSSATEGGGKVSVMGIGSAGLEGSTSSEAVTRIKFAVPIDLPRKKLPPRTAVVESE